jgi:hypothetical protein
MVSFDCPEKRLKDAVLSEAFSNHQIIANSAMRVVSPFQGSL